MQSSPAKKASITLPPPLEGQLRDIAKKEHRTLSGVIQEAARFYIGTRQWEELQREISIKARRMGIYTEDGVDKIIHELREET